MYDYSFKTQRPVDLRGAARVIEQLVGIGREIREDKSTWGSEYPDFMSARHEVIGWTDIVCKQIDVARASTLPWHPTSLSYMTESGNLPRYVDTLKSLYTELELWADERDIFGTDEPSGDWVLLGDQPYTAWRRCQQIVSEAGVEVYVCDPYVDARTLDLVLGVPPDVRVKILTATEAWRDSLPEEWRRWAEERGGDSELRLRQRQLLPHDRLLLVDNQVYLSGASFKDVGRRMSVITLLETPSVCDSIRSLLENEWSNGTAP